MFDNVDWGATILTLVVAFIGSGVISTFILKKHEKEMSELNSKLETNIYISNRQFENELKIFQELWESLYNLYVYKDHHEKYYIFEQDPLSDFVTESYKNGFSEVFNQFDTIFGKYEPFLEEDLCEIIKILKKEFKEYKNMVNELHWNGKMNGETVSEEDDGKLNSYSEQVEINMNSLRDMIRDHLKQLLNRVRS